MNSPTKGDKGCFDEKRSLRATKSYVNDRKKGFVQLPNE
jgi:hypothetical protein